MRILVAGWLLGSYGLYLLVGVCWLPVVWIQMKVRDLAQLVVDGDATKMQEIAPLMRLWFLLGWPAFAGVLGIYFLMVVKP